MKLKLNLDEEPFILLEDSDVEAFRRTALWKLRMPAVKRNAIGFDGQRILLKPSLTRVDRQRITETLESLMAKNPDLDVEIVTNLSATSPESILEEKSRVGLAIKGHNAELFPELAEFQHVVDGEMVRRLRDRQMWDAFYMCAMRSSANFSVPGSGKTASTLGTFAYLKKRGLVSRLLVICPKNAFASWKDEWKACFGSEHPCRCLCFHDSRYLGVPKESRRRELRLNAGRFDLILINYEAVGSYANELGQIASTSTMLVFDEVHKVKQIGGKRAGSALEVALDAQYTVALTGTPIPNSYQDLYNLLHILYPRDYDDFFGFRPNQLLKPSEVEIEAINDALQPFFCRTNKSDLGVPAASDDLIYTLHASSLEQQLFEYLKRTYRKDPLALIIRLLQMESDPSMLGLGLTDEELEGLFDERHEEPLTLDPLTPKVRKYIEDSPMTVKTRKCIELGHRLLSEGKPVIIWCFFKKSMNNLKRELRRLGWKAEVISGEVAQEERDEILAGFKSGRVHALITNPHTLAESVSLHSMCHDAIYFEYSYNLVHLLQSKDRIHRLGLPQGQYTQYHYLQTFFDVDGEDWSLDSRIYDRLHEKEQTMLEAIDNGVLEIGSTDENDLALVFQGLFTE